MISEAAGKSLGRRKRRVTRAWPAHDPRNGPLMTSQVSSWHASLGALISLQVHPIPSRCHSDVRTSDFFQFFLIGRLSNIAGVPRQLHHWGPWRMSRKFLFVFDCCIWFERNIAQDLNALTRETRARKRAWARKLDLGASMRSPWALMRALLERE